MKISKDELISVLSPFNPWWRSESIADLPHWRRAAFRELYEWVYTPPVHQAVLLSGARQVGKTTLLLQIIEELLKAGVPAANILYATFDHPIIKLAGIEAVLEAWREREPKVNGLEYLFLDEAQFIREWGTWVKHQVDFFKNRRIIFTGSSMPLMHKGQESGVGRWHTIRLTTLSFFEYLQLKKTRDQQQLAEQHHLPPLPLLKSLNELFDWPVQKFHAITELAAPYVAYFHEYLLRGGFPQTAQVDNIHQAQRLLREDIIEKILKRDMTVLFGVRNVLELEQTFLYLCMHDSGLLDMKALCSNLEVKRPTAQHFIELLEAAHLIYRLQPFGYGKEILRAKYKVYLADAAIAPAVMLLGKAALDNPEVLAVATETAVFKHLYTRFYAQGIRFAYWRGSKNHEVDLVAEINSEIIPFEVKYRAKHTGVQELKGLLELCQEKSIRRGYVITKSLRDFGPFTESPRINTSIMKLPAPLLCYWTGASELESFKDELSFI